MYEVTLALGKIRGWRDLYVRRHLSWEWIRRCLLAFWTIQSSMGHSISRYSPSVDRFPPNTTKQVSY